MLERHMVLLPDQDCASFRYQFVMFPSHPTSVTDAQNTHIGYFTLFTHTISAVCPWDSKCPLPLKVCTPSSGVSRSGQVRSFSCSLSVTSRPAGQHAAAPTLPCTCGSGPLLHMACPSSHRCGYGCCSVRATTSHCKRGAYECCSSQS